MPGKLQSAMMAFMSRYGDGAIDMVVEHAQRASNQAIRRIWLALAYVIVGIAAHLISEPDWEL